MVENTDIMLGSWFHVLFSVFVLDGCLRNAMWCKRILGNQFVLRYQQGGCVVELRFRVSPNFI